MPAGSQDLLDRYLVALQIHDDPHEEETEGLPPGYDVRTCASCGAHTEFRIDPEGDWAECTNCGHLA
jgi:hypothetical protein